MLRTKPINTPIANPGAGAEWSKVLSTTDRAVIVSITATFTSDATVASRYPGISYVDQEGTVYMQSASGQAHAASRAASYNWAKVAGTNLTAAIQAGQVVTLDLPDLWLSPGDALTSIAVAEDAGDTWTNILVRYYTGEQWLELQAELAALQALQG